MKLLENKYFNSIKERCEKICDIVLDEDIGKRMVPIETIHAIVDNTFEWYKKERWHYIHKNDIPINSYGTNELEVLVHYKKHRWLRMYDTVIYKFDKQKFYSHDGVDVTDIIRAWSEIPSI